MAVLTIPLRALVALNTVLLRIGRHAAWMALGLMVIIILLQIGARFTTGALNWTEEAARFLMLWLTGLIAPSAYRWGGFVAIDTIPRALPKTVAHVLLVLLLALSLAVLIVGAGIGWGEVTGFPGTFDTAALYTFFFPSIGDLTVTFGWDRMPRSHMMASLLVGVCLMILVNVELLVKALLGLIAPALELPQDPDQTAMAGTE
ncbi:MAG: TRAP transporter small permease subunit [Pseudomonadota bacterium]